MKEETHDIDQILFGIYSNEEIKKISVCKVDSSKLSNIEKTGGFGTVYDPRMGTIENGKLCGTCNQDNWNCPGHWGYIELHEPVIHPLFYKQVVSFLSCFCVKCYSLLIQEDNIIINGLNKYKSTTRFQKILEKLEKIDFCYKCGQVQPDIKYSTTDNNINFVYKQKKGKVNILTNSVEDIKKTFDNIEDKEVELLGFDINMMHPKNLILTVFPVLPIACRPYVISDGNIYDDDLTIQLVEIVKANNHLKQEDGVPVPETKKQKYLQSLKFRISTFYNNSCLAPDTEILMWDGSIKTAKEIQIGDELIGDDGEKRTVQVTCEGTDEMYEISEEKGDSYIVNSNHYLTLKFTDHKRIIFVNPNQKFKNGCWRITWFDGTMQTQKNISITHTISKEEAYNKMLDFAETIDDSNVFDIQVKEYLKMPEYLQKKLFGMKLSQSIKWEHKHVDLDPYILGMWLGDGNSLGTGFTSQDPELINAWKSWAEKNNAEVVLHRKKLKKGDKGFIEDEVNYRPDICFGIKSKSNNRNNKSHENPFKKLLRKYNLVDNKHIPKEYLYNDEETRLKLLAGFIDTDGYKDGNSFGLSQSSVREKLIYQLKFLAQTLGFTTSIVNQPTKWKAKGEIRTGSRFVLRISGLGIDKIPTMLSRKKCVNPKDTSYRSIKIKSLGIGKYNGFVIDSNHRFLLSQLSITHNSGRAKHTTNGRAIKGLKERLTGKDGIVRTNLLGKRCIKEGENVLQWDGKLKKVEDIKIGDELVGDDGKKRTVINMCSGVGDMYKIIQKKGEDYIVNDEHILSLKFTNTKKATHIPSKGWFMQWFDKNTMKIKTRKFNKCESEKDLLEEIEKCKNQIDDDNVIDIPIKEYLKLPDVTKKLLFGYKLDTSIQWENKKVEIDPYILGMWLGDGGAKGTAFTTVDTELLEYWKKWADENDMIVTKYEDGTNMQYGITGTKLGKNIFKEKLNRYNLVHNKHIPDDYLYNDTQTRLALLAGLIDTDGSVESDSRLIAITQSYEHQRILTGAKFIASSLGFQTSLKNKKTSWTHKGIKKTGTALTLYISGHGVENIPTLLKRKKCYPPKTETVTCTNIKVEYYGVAKYYGLEVDNNKRFLLGDFTVTHNCEYTGRTVIGPDPTLKMGQLAVPPEIAKNLTIPVKVTTYNIDWLQGLVDEHKVNYVLKEDGKTKINLDSALFFRGTRLQHGDIIIRDDTEIIVNDGKELLKVGDQVRREGHLLTELKYPCPRRYKLTLGDVCERQLMNGDIVLLNRQPTLHDASMMAQEVVIIPGKTLRFNLAITSSFNADFDGDEMNLHVPQSEEAQAELRLLSASKYKITSSQSSKPNMCIVQDSLLGAYKMTLGLKKISKEQFFQIAMRTSLSQDAIHKKMNHIRKVYRDKGMKAQCFHGKGLVSLILPENFYYEKNNKGPDNEPVLKIENGVLYEGALNKVVLGRTPNSLIQIINKEYGPDVTTEFIDNIQFITHAWLLIEGFTVGIGDCIVTNKEKQSEIQDIVTKCFMEADNIANVTNHPGIKEIRINAALNKARDVGLKIAKDTLDPTNNFLSTVRSGSKGDYFNIAQITGLLGQQNLQGKRVSPCLNNNTRTLPHYPFEGLPIDLKYESRGFVQSSFIKGLNPREFYFHAMSGRESCCDTAMNTSVSGYIQRRIVKLTEDIKVQYDGTVRDCVGSIYQTAYGDDNIDPREQVRVDDELTFCDISSMVNKMNMEEEKKSRKRPAMDDITKKISKMRVS